MVRVGPIMAVPQLLTEWGTDAARVLAEFDLEPAFFRDPENRLPFADSCRLLSRCAAVTRCQYFGLLVGQRARISSLGAIGLLAQSAPDVRSALETVAHHYRLHNPGVVLDILEGDSVARLIYNIVQPGITDTEQLLDGVMAVAFNMMRTLCGDGWLPLEVRFAHARPLNVAQLQQFFRAPLVFESSETAIVFAGDWLERTRPGADSLLHSLMQRHVQVLEAQVDDDLVDNLRRMLPSLISARLASPAHAARRIALGVRTLNRRLEARGTSFSQLREEARYTIACHLLDDTRLTAKRIADYLGYANPSAFSHAFRRWSGKSPAMWRTSTRRRTRHIGSRRGIA